MSLCGNVDNRPAYGLTKRHWTVWLWDVASGYNVGTLIGHTASIESVAFSPDGKILAAGSDDRTVQLWDVATTRARARMGGTSISTLKGHADRVMSVAFSPNGKMLASGSADTTVRLWKVYEHLR